MENTAALSMMRPGDTFAGLVGRLLLTQAEVCRLLALNDGSARIMPDGGCDPARLASVAGALSEALLLVGDDALVALWLRSPLPRRGGASPIDEVELVEGDRLIRFVLLPHPHELVRLIADLESWQGPVPAIVQEHGRSADA